MPNYCHNYIKVFGNRNELVKFKNFVADGQTVFSPEMIKPFPKGLMAEDYDPLSPGEMGPEPEDLISEHIWVIENWGMDRWPLYTKIEDKKDYLDYEVVTTAVPPEPLFFALFVKFPNYDYDIFSWEEFNAFKYELIFKNGEVSKRIKTYWETEPFGNKKSKIITLEYNYLSKTEQVVEIRTYDNGKLPYFPGSEEGQVDGTITKKYTG